VPKIAIFAPSTRPGLELPFDFVVLSGFGYEGPVTVAICESARGGAAGGEGGDEGVREEEEEVWVLQSATGWARGALDQEMEGAQMCDELLEAFAAALGEKAGLDGLPAVVAAEAVVWPYGDMDYELEGGCAWLGEQRLALAGDWCFNGRVEGAWLSGRAAAERVIAANCVR
jgi:hypothetical protein